MARTGCHKNARPHTLIFDVNDTLPDLGPVRKFIDEALGEEGAAALWFSSPLHHSLVMTGAQQHAEFPRIGCAVLGRVCRLPSSPLRGSSFLVWPRRRP